MIKFTNNFSEIRTDTFAPNVVLLGLACHHRMRIVEVALKFSPRFIGEVSIQKWKLFKVAVQSFWQTVKFSF